MDFSMIGAVASLVTPAGRRGHQCFCCLDVDTDYLLVNDYELPRALAGVMAAGHAVK